MLYEAAFWRTEERNLSLTQMLADDHLRRYVDGWGCPSDIGVIAEDDGKTPVGAAWFRLFTAKRPGYGFIDGATPEVSIAVKQNRRGIGIGTALLQHLLEDATTARIPALSLSVSAENPALHLYERAGFVKVKRIEGSWTMRCRLRNPD